MWAAIQATFMVVALAVKHPHMRVKWVYMCHTVCTGISANSTELLNFPDIPIAALMVVLFLCDYGCLQCPPSRPWTCGAPSHIMYSARVVVKRPMLSSFTPRPFLYIYKNAFSKFDHTSAACLKYRNASKCSKRQT